MKNPNKINPYKPSKDEMYISNYLDYCRISNKEQYKIEGLYGDEKYAYRIADFYLDKLGIYVEYYGLYNSTKEKRAEYDLKTDVYIKNNLPTVIIFPHELGYLDFAFHTKILKLLRLKKFYNKRKVLRYKMNRYLNNGKGYYLFLSLFTLFISLQGLATSQSKYDLFFTVYLICLAVFGYLFYRFIENIYYYLYKEY